MPASRGHGPGTAPSRGARKRAKRLTPCGTSQFQPWRGTRTFLEKSFGILNPPTAGPDKSISPVNWKGRAMTKGEFSKNPSFGGRLINWIVVRQQRRADRKILTALATFPHRDSFTNELERRLAGQ